MSSFLDYAAVQAKKIVLRQQNVTPDGKSFKSARHVMGYSLDRDNTLQTINTAYDRNIAGMKAEHDYLKKLIGASPEDVAQNFNEIVEYIETDFKKDLRKVAEQQAKEGYLAAAKRYRAARSDYNAALRKGIGNTDPIEDAVDALEEYTKKVQDLLDFKGQIEEALATSDSAQMAGGGSITSLVDINSKNAKAMKTTNDMINQIFGNSKAQNRKLTKKQIFATLSSGSMAGIQGDLFEGYSMAKIGAQIDEIAGLLNSTSAKTKIVSTGAAGKVSAKARGGMVASSAEHKTDVKVENDKLRIGLSMKAYMRESKKVNYGNQNITDLLEISKITKGGSNALMKLIPEYEGEGESYDFWRSKYLLGKFIAASVSTFVVAGLPGDRSQYMVYINGVQKSYQALEKIKKNGGLEPSKRPSKKDFKQKKNEIYGAMRKQNLELSGIGFTG